MMQLHLPSLNPVRLHQKSVSGQRFISYDKKHTTNNLKGT